MYGILTQKYTPISLYIFIFSKVSFIDAGVYTCIATNKYGTASASGTLTVTGIPTQFKVFTFKY